MYINTIREICGQLVAQRLCVSVVKNKGGNMKNTENFFPDIIKNLPDAEINFKGVKGKLLQGEDSQLVFMEIEPIGEVPPHTHGAQWGILLKGEMILTIGEETKTYRKGDSYYIPANTLHSATFNTKVYVLDFFEDKDRYKRKKTKV